MPFRRPARTRRARRGVLSRSGAKAPQNTLACVPVKIRNPNRRYILWEAEEHGLLLPYACRMGCCTACAVRIKEGEMYQPQVRTPKPKTSTLNSLSHGATIASDHTKGELPCAPIWHHTRSQSLLRG